MKLFNEGLSIDLIAKRRNLVQSAIEGHLSHFVKEEVTPIDCLISAEKFENILAVIDEIHSISFSGIKEKLGNEYSYGEIEIVLAHHAFSNPVNDVSKS